MIARTARTAALTVAAAAALAAVARTGETEVRAPRIAFVDVDRVLGEYKKGKDRYEQIKAKFEPKANSIKQRAQAVGEERRRIETNPRTDQVEYLKKKQEIEMQLAKLQQDEKEYMEGRTADELKAMAEVWNDMMAAVSAHARDNGIDIVIKQQARDEPVESKAAFHRSVSSRTLLYAAAKLDITEEILKKLNTEYERGGGGSGAGGGGNGNTKSAEPKG
jgi:Skp family chaperone for outer membrane proteins